MMMDWYYEQIEHQEPITWEALNQLHNKKYESGRDIKVGELVFFGYLMTGEKTSTLIKFHMDELNTLYKVVTENPTTPTLCLISTGS